MIVNFWMHISFSIFPRVPKGILAMEERFREVLRVNILTIDHFGELYFLLWGNMEAKDLFWIVKMRFDGEPGERVFVC